MLAYFIRRIIAGIAKLWVLSFVIFYIVVEMPGGPRDQIRIIDPTPSKEYMQFMDRNLHIDRPWPGNYVDWLFDPYALKLSPDGKLYTQASGALTGNFGVSSSIDSGTPVTDVFGPGISEMFAFLTTLIAALMALVAAQRWRRPPPYRVSILPTASALLDWWQQHARSPLDVAIIGRQWA